VGRPELARDPFCRPAGALADFLLHTYYPHERAVGELRPASAPLDGVPAWRLVLPLAVDDPSLDFAEETFVLVLAEREGEVPAVLFASLPTAPDVPSAEDVLGFVERAGT
jgi:proteasome lid subunit RPN8/RPN11